MPGICFAKKTSMPFAQQFDIYQYNVAIQRHPFVSPAHFVSGVVGL